MLLALTLLALAATPPSALSADDAQQRLVSGNARFVSGSVGRVDLAAERQTVVASGERPWCTVLSCSEARVPPEQIFDARLGSLSTVRVAGNVAEPITTASIEHAVAQGARLVVVLGHEDCGAVRHALGNASAGPNLDLLAAYIRPAVTSGMALGAAVEANIRHQMDVLSESPSLHAAVSAGKARIVGALYDLDTGKVSFLGDRPPITEAPTAADPTSSTTAEGAPGASPPVSPASTPAPTRPADGG
jgi:carbonic anhydrase